MNLYKLKTSALLKLIRMEHLVFILCLVFAKPIFEIYELLTKLSQTSKLNFHMKTVNYFNCKVIGNYKKSSVV